MKFPLIGFDPSAYLVSRQTDSMDDGKTLQRVDVSALKEVQQNGPVSSPKEIESTKTNGHAEELNDKPEEQRLNGEHIIPQCVPYDHHLKPGTNPDDLKYDISAFAVSHPSFTIAKMVL